MVLLGVLPWKRRLGGGGVTSGGRTRGPRVGGSCTFRCARSSSRTSSLCSRLPGRGDDDVAGHVHRAVVRRERAPRDGRDHLARPDHRPSERVVAEDGLREEVVDELLRRVLVHRDLLEHDLALGVELGERRREDHVGHHVDRRLEVRVRHARVDAPCAPATSPRSARRRARRRSRRSPARCSAPSP